ncbi:MAG: hypothetical protein LBV69_02750 [Bacteroidales bacterium]|jgi:hypothetical protein|nr:hypothetical protein [Bacteroidales bacterium]
MDSKKNNNKINLSNETLLQINEMSKIVGGDGTQTNCNCIPDPPIIAKDNVCIPLPTLVYHCKCK